MYTFTVAEDYQLNTDLQNLKGILSIDDTFISMLVANNINHSSQLWFYKVLKESNLFSIFNVFEVDTDKIKVIKAFIDYNDNPSLINLNALVVLILGTDVIISNTAGCVTITVPFNVFSSNLEYTTDGNTFNFVEYTTDGSTFNEVGYILSTDVEVVNSAFYFIKHFIPVGVELKLIFTNRDAIS